MNSFDIFFLFETHVLAEKQINFSSFFKDYIICWVKATKNHSLGRAIGGGLYGFRKSIQSKYSLKFCEFSNSVTLSAVFNDVCFHFVPIYLNSSNWSNDFNKFENLMYSLKGAQFCIVGDLNARVSNAQVLDKNMLIDSPLISHSRRSKDQVLDTKGKKLMALLENIGGIIINGRMASDIDGEYTFCGVMGSSLIDYCICSLDVTKMLSDFYVPSKPYSDHMPIVVSICSNNNHQVRDLSLPQKLYWNSRNIADYNRKLSSLVDPVYLQSSISIQEKVNLCTGKIRVAADYKFHRKRFEPRNKWFDSQCENARKRMFNKLDIYRKTDTDFDRITYIANRSKYSKLCEVKKLKFKINNIDKLNSVRNSSEFWNLSNSLKNCRPKVGNNLTISHFHEYFETLLSKDDLYCDVDIPINNIIDPFLDSPFEMRELDIVLKTAKSNKAPGEDRISYEFYKNAPLRFLEEVLALLNIIFLREDFPDSFRSSIIIPLYKKGDVNVVTNYRGLSLLDTMYKIFTGLLLNRINSWVLCNNVINEFQAGFRKNYSTTDNLFNLTSIVNLNFKQNRKTYAFFVDFSAAFDMIPRKLLFYKLCCLGLSQKIVRVLQKLYTNTTSKIWDGKTLSSSFTVTQGVKQGCLLSPVLFSLYLNDLHDYLPGGTAVGGTNVKILLYADDIVLLADSPIVLQNMINTLYDYCNQWSLKINLEKSKIMIFRTCTRVSQNTRWKFGNNEIDVVNDYKYLGINLTFNLSFKKHLESKLALSKTAINANWLNYIHDPKINFSNKLKIFHSAAKSIMFYGAQVWGFLSFDAVEKLLRYFLKNMLYLPKNTPTYMLHIETGISSLYLETLNLHFSYIRKTLNLPVGRLPRLLAEESIRQNSFWVPHWKALCSQFGFTLDTEIWRTNLQYFHNQIIQSLRNTEHENFLVSARNSQFHDMYPALQHEFRPYFCDSNSAHLVSLVLKARGGLLNLNARAFNGNDNNMCTLCNCNEQENTNHLIGKCPIFSSYRLKFLGKRFLSIEEVYEVLNGIDYMRLYKYLLNCIKYRNLILSEFHTI